MLANMRFLGHLFLRKLLAAKVLCTVVYELLNPEDRAASPQDHLIECVCELLESVGHTLDSTKDGGDFLHAIFRRLKELRTVCSKRMKFRIENLLELRAKKWQ